MTLDEFIDDLNKLKKSPKNPDGGKIKIRKFSDLDDTPEISIKWDSFNEFFVCLIKG